MIEKILNFLIFAVETEQQAEQAFNKIVFEPSRILQYDGVIITIVGYTIVFASLLILFFFIKNMTRFLTSKQYKRIMQEGSDIKDKSELEISGETSAAISMALYLYLNQHDIEEAVLTINRVNRIYQPWSSKIYNITPQPFKEK